MLQSKPNWAAVVTPESPYEVRLFITKKCAPISDGGENRKVAII